MIFLRQVSGLKQVYCTKDESGMSGEGSVKKSVDEQILVKDLKNSNSSAHHNAILALRRSGGETREAVPVLVEALKWGNNWEVRCQAIETLGKIGKEAREAVPVLIEVLKSDSDLAVRCKAVEILGKIIGKEAVPTLIEVFKSCSNNEELNYSVLKALRELGEEAREAAPELIDVLKKEFWEKDCGISFFPCRVAEALGKIIGKEAVPTLIETFKNDNNSSEVRCYAAWALKGIGEEAREAIPVLLEAIKNDNESGFRAAEALADIGKEVIPELIKILKSDSDYNVRMQAVRVFRDMGEETKEAAKEAVPVLIEVLKSCRNELFVYRTTIEALGNIGDKAAVPALIEVLKSSKSIFQEAAWALGSIGEEAREAVPALIEALNSDSPSSSGVSWALGNIGDKAAVPALIEVLKNSNSDSRVCRSVVKALERIGGEAREAVPALIEVLKSDSNSCFKAIDILEEIGEQAKEAVPVLIKVLKSDNNPNMRNGAARALGRIGGKEAVLALIEVLKNSNSDDSLDHYKIVEALGYMGTKASDALPALVEIQKKDSGGDNFLSETIEIIEGKRKSYTPFDL